ncbi:hypothetical protein [Streptomyces werraensis]|uniref:hypothetical protein n=1 Tax=Streptomyces werraensis TaxID=68284 RepID=UPI00381BD2C7
MDELIEHVKRYALEHYSHGGWDVVVECWEDEEIRRWLETEAGTELTVPTTPDEAITKMMILVDVWAERQADADFYRSEA